LAIVVGWHALASRASTFIDMDPNVWGTPSEHPRGACRFSPPSFRQQHDRPRDHDTHGIRRAVDFGRNLRIAHAKFHAHDDQFLLALGQRG
jgi:hypothetical protein